MEDKKFHSGRVEWVIANLILGAGFEDMLQAMIADGFSEAYASARLAEYEQNVTVMAARKAMAVQHKAADILESLGKLEHKSPFSKQVDVVRNLPAADFYRDYFFRNRPAVLKGLTSEWKAMQLWTPEYFASRFGDALVEVVTGRESDPEHEYNFDQHKTQVAMRDYIRMVVEGGETNDFYLIAQNYLLGRPEFQKLYGHITSLDGYLDDATMRGRVRVWIGPKGIITRLHHDAAPVMMAQVYGHKQVKLISPFHLSNVSSDGEWLCTLDLDHLDYTRFPKMRNVDILEVTLEPGDLLFIPLGWWHWVKGLDVTISLSLDNFQIARDEIELLWNRDI
jgi:ribosomal protein L16 Arg81 hydroxylase